jgi:LysR family glycine cleavage system transcriptional activator
MVAADARLAARGLTTYRAMFVSFPHMTHSTLPLKALQAFEATMRLGGVGRAAERLGVTHGAVSRQIGQLQAILGAALFEGPRNARRPTAEAERLWAEIAPAFATLAAAVAGRSGAQRLRVSCLSTLAARWLIPRLAAFAAEAPDVAVELTESYAALDRTLGGADLAIRMQPAGAATPRGLTATAFMKNHFGLVASPALGDGASARRLVSRSHPRAWTEWSALSGQAAPPGPAIEFDHQQTMIEAALAGLGAAVTQEALVETDLAAGRLSAPHGFVSDGALYAAFGRTGDTSTAARRFVAWLGKQGRLG